MLVLNKKRPVSSRFICRDIAMLNSRVSAVHGTHVKIFTKYQIAPNWTIVTKFVVHFIKKKTEYRMATIP